STPNLLEGQHAGGEGATGRHRGATVGSGESRGTDRETDGGLGEPDDDAELNPVEWIMVTRSDPGGGIPRFLVDRGTPDAMLSDIGKFLDWAASQSDGMQPAGAPQTTEQEAPKSAALSDNQGDSAVQPLADTAPATDSDVQQQGGLMSNVTQAVGTGITAYAPTAVTNQLHDYLHPTHAPTSEPTAAQDSYDDDSSDSSSDTSFMSAAEMRRLSTAPETQGEASSLRSATSSSLEGSEKKKNLNSHEKEVQKLMRQREKLDSKLAKKREEEEQKMKKAQDKDRSEEDKQRERHEKEMQKAEDRHRKEIGKLEAKKEKEARKAEEKRRKKDDRLKLGMVSRERDEVRREAEALRKENGALAGRVEELERENKGLVERLGGLGADGGEEGKRSLESLEGKGC
ncbi:hypothetical protein B0A55_11580, partial [Friedmanniomyces simplex]